MATKKTQPSASTTEVVQALTKALQKNAAPRGVASVIEPNSLGEKAIEPSEAIKAKSHNTFRYQNSALKRGIIMFRQLPKRLFTNSAGETLVFGSTTPEENARGVLRTHPLELAAYLDVLGRGPNGC